MSDDQWAFQTVIDYRVRSKLLFVNIEIGKSCSKHAVDFWNYAEKHLRYIAMVTEKTKIKFYW